MISALPDDLALEFGEQNERRPGYAAAERVAFVVSALEGDPAGEAALAWISFLADRGEDVEAVAIRRLGGSDALPAAVPLWRVRRTPGMLQWPAAIARLFSTRRYSTVVAVGTIANLVAVAALWRSAHRPALILVEQDLLSLNAAAGSFPARAKAWLARRLYRYADAVVSPSHAVAAEIAAAFGVPSSRSLVVPNPALTHSTAAGTGANATASSAPEGAPRDDDYPADGIELVVLSMLAPDAHPELALHTAAALSGRGLPTHVVALQDGPLSGRLASLASSLGVPFTSLAGAPESFQELGPRAVGLLTSPRRGSGDELVRAAARGLPVVALSTALGVADGVIPGVTGELALDDDPESVADAVTSAVSLRVEGIDDWLDRFTAEGSGRLLVEVIGHVSAGRV